LINTAIISIPPPDTIDDINDPCRGCVHTIGYWKTHAGFTGNNLDYITPLLGKEGIWLGTAGRGKSIWVTTASEAVNYLDFMGNYASSKEEAQASNGINKLYAQLLAAKLNIANRAASQTIFASLIEADAELELHNLSDWANLSKAQKNHVNQLATDLDNYNKGLIGPPQCSEVSGPKELLLSIAKSAWESTDKSKEDTEKNQENIRGSNNGYTINITIQNSSNFRIYLHQNKESNKK
jgi:hypothetical protein